jgi:ribosomal protein S18 acetylase RimI-like enzyme
VTLGPLDLDLHGPAAIALTREAFVESFGSSERFDAELGVDGSGVVEQLKQRLAADPTRVWGATEDGRLVGLLVLGRFEETPPVGHLILIAVVPEARGTGLADRLLVLGEETLARSGYGRARLRVAARNTRALRFYRRHGWTDAGESSVPGLRVFERPLHEDVSG